MNIDVAINDEKKLLNEYGLCTAIKGLNSKTKAYVVRKKLDDLYRKTNLNEKQRDEYHFICDMGLGDTMIVCGYMGSFKRQYEADVCLYIKPSHEVVMKMYDYTNYKIQTFSEAERSKTTNTYPVKGEFFVTHPLACGRMDLIQDFYEKRTCFLHMYRDLLCLSEKAEFAFPSHLPNISAKELFQPIDLEKTVIIAPELNATDIKDQIPLSFYEHEAAKWRNLGYKVITNAINSKNVIEGTEQWKLSLDILLNIAPKCHRVISSRSGLCDLLFSFTNNIEVVYPNLDFWNLYNFRSVYGNETIREVVADDKECIPAKYDVTVITTIKDIIKSNRKKYLLRCIESVKKQVGKVSIEHLIIDGGSCDGTREFVKKHIKSGNIRYVYQPDSGIYQGMNNGIYNANGRYICFLNSDDCFLDENTVYESFKLLTEKNKDYVFSNTRYVDDENIVHDEILQAVPDMKNALLTMPFCHQSMFTKRRVLLANRFSEHFKSISDFEQFLKLFIKRFSYGYINKTFIEFRLDGGMTTNAENAGFIREECASAYKSIFDGVYPKYSYEDCLQMACSNVIPDDIRFFLQKLTNRELRANLDNKSVFYPRYVNNIINRSRIKTDDISVVIQGPYQGDVTDSCIRSIRSILPGAEIILSTWPGKERYPDVEKLIINEDPGCGYDGANWDRPLNINRWIVSSLHGVAVARGTYVLKVRQDVKLVNHNFLDAFFQYSKRDQRFTISRHRIVLPSIYTMRYLGGNPGCAKIYTPFHVSDWFCFGTKADILDFCNIPEIDDIRGFARFFDEHRFGNYKYTWWLDDWRRKYAAEQYIGLNFAKKRFCDLDIVDATNLSKSPQWLSDQILLNNFIILDPKEFGVILNKDQGYVDLCTHIYQMQRFVWKGFYRSNKFKKDYQLYLDSNYCFYEKEKLDDEHNRYWKSHS